MGVILGQSQGGGGGAATGVSGWIKIADVAVTGGTASNKIYQDTANTILQQATISALTTVFDVLSSYPLITIDGSPYQLTQSADDGHYSGSIPHTLSAAGNIQVQCTDADNNPAAIDTINLLLDEPPELLTLSFTGGYPGSQTELKAGDTFQLTGTTDKAADRIEIIDFGACINEVKVVSGTTFTVTGTIADRGTSTQALPARCRARDASTGAYGGTRDTNQLGGTTDGVDLVNLNNLYPTVTYGAINYPLTQQALKNSESASVAVTLANLDTVLFDSPNSELSITNPTLIEASKIVTRIAGTYNISVNNLRATANRAANDATTVQQTVVNIAHVAAQLSVVLPAARLRSGGNDGTAVQNHTITLNSNQQLLSAPTLDEDTGGGTFIGSWAGGPTSYTRTLQVDDDDVKATYNWQNLLATNLANILTNTLTVGASYVLGGFVSRDLTLAAFANETTMNVVAVTYNKVTIDWEVKSLPTQSPVGTTVPPPIPNAWCLAALSPSPVTVRILDTSATSSSSVPTTVTMEETV